MNRCDPSRRTSRAISLPPMPCSLCFPKPGSAPPISQLEPKRSNLTVAGVLLPPKLTRTAWTMPRQKPLARPAADHNPNPSLKRPPWPGANAVADRTYNVLFLCTGNSARSIIAEAILNKVGAGRFRAWSAGSQPKGQVNPHTLALLGGLGFDVTGFRSKAWDEFTKPGAPKFDFIFTVCDNAAGETCPVWPGNPMTTHWGIPDPAEATANSAGIALAFKDAY